GKKKKRKGNAGKKMQLAASNGKIDSPNNKADHAQLSELPQLDSDPNNSETRLVTSNLGDAYLKGSCDLEKDHALNKQKDNEQEEFESIVPIDSKEEESSHNGTAPKENVAFEGEHAVGEKK